MTGYLLLKIAHANGWLDYHQKHIILQISVQYLQDIILLYTTLFRVLYALRMMNITMGHFAILFRT
jgi:hypothetical protein